MQIEGWEYYNHAIIPNSAPHIKPDVEKIKNKKNWDRRAFFARYTTNFDCKKETEWWYCIKDTPINIDDMKSNKRYKINKGLRYVDVKKISPEDYSEELYKCFEKATERYETYKNFQNKETFKKSLKKDMHEYWAAFCKKTGAIVAYTINKVDTDSVDFSVLKFDPEYMKYQVSAAILYVMIYEYINNQGKKYVCDGARCINHKTNIQEYLEDMFGFRKAYCKLNLVYRKPFGMLVKIIFPLRKILGMFDSNRLLANINSVLRMEEIVRKQKKEKLV